METPRTKTFKIKEIFLTEWLDDILEYLQDKQYLSEKGIEFRKQIWEEVEKGKWFYDDPFEKTWDSFNEWEREFLIREMREWFMNKRATEFILSKTKI